MLRIFLFFYDEKLAGNILLLSHQAHWMTQNPLNFCYIDLCCLGVGISLLLLPIRA